MGSATIRGLEPREPHRCSVTVPDAGIVGREILEGERRES
jgi:hypothetical protein